ncbi:signal peptide peptidase SppA [Bacteroidia bacterium]|nr:signal peptide peptidase SppA [Bacteroidia bacterium]
MKKVSFWKIFFACLVALLVYGIVKLIFVISAFSGFAAMGESKPVAVKDNSILEIKLLGDIPDRASDDPMSNVNMLNLSMNKPTLSMEQIISSVEYAKNDSKIKGIYINSLACIAGYANLYELRNVLKDFKESGKFIYAYGDSYSQKDYYIASVADSVIAGNEAVVEFKGLTSQFTSLKGFLEKIGVEMQIVRHGKFKSAVEPYFLDKMSEENKLQTKKFIDGIWGVVIEDVASSRNKSVEELNKIVDENPFVNTAESIKLGLIDVAMTRPEYKQFLMKTLAVEKEDDLNYIDVPAYAKYAKSQVKNTSKNKIAVIYAQGEIANVDGDVATIGDNICEAIHKAANDDKVKAIVLRVNSPGGSASQSEFILDEIKLAKEKKPVVASFGNYAASGGYYISCQCSYIVCNPACLTGSIGVFGTIPNPEKLLNDKLGLKFENVSTNAHSDFLTGVKPMSDFEKNIMQKYVEETYSTFVSHVATGRNMEKSNVDSIGQGRVWCGVNALEIGLIDTFGGLNDAVKKAAELAELEDYKIVVYPKVKDFAKVRKFYIFLTFYS